jgi:hypothetical protein
MNTIGELPATKGSAKHVMLVTQFHGTISQKHHRNPWGQ